MLYRGPPSHRAPLQRPSPTSANARARQTIGAWRGARGRIVYPRGYVGKAVRMAGRIADPWGERNPYRRGGDWPIRVDEYIDSPVERWVQSACVLCSHGCALDVGVRGGRIVGVRGRGVDRVNHGRLGPKGLYGWQANNSADRLLRPLVRRDGELREASWDEAMDLIVGRTRELLVKKGAGALGFYTSGQLFLEDYYTLALVARGGLGTNHLDGNTRLCTATAGQALKETFGCDGQPAGVHDLEYCDTILHVGINTAETQTVLWMHELDRLRGPDPPRSIVIDPRETESAREAEVHLAIKPGTNLAILNGLAQQLIENGRLDREFLDAHTVGLEALERTVSPYTPERVAEICGVAAREVRRAAEIVGEAERLLTFVLQGVYQSHQATASACAANNVNLLRGMIGRPGSGILQMNGQPTAQNTRETGCNGDLPGFRNWQNEAHVAELARLWNVEPLQIPHWGPPTHAMEIFRYAEQGSIGFLWVSGTNPAVSLPELRRIRSILSSDGLFLVVSDAFLTETARLADVVLPAALWGEKTGTFTNTDRTVHLSERAVDPPGDARPDMEIFLDYARRLDLRDRDGDPLVKWSAPEECFEAWKECTRGRPCDYTGLSYEKLRGGSGVQWPCNDEAPDGTERLYQDLTFATFTELCEDYGHDVETGAALSEAEFRALDPRGRAILKTAEWTQPHEWARDEYPFALATGRTVYHFHTRTKTGRAPELQAAAPDAWMELCADDAERLGVTEGELLRVSSPRGSIEAPARIGPTRQGVVFVPFHYGYWDTGDGAGPDGRPRAANELTMTIWDPVSKQPQLKTAAVKVERLR
jgi:anaerobic selenocysteine-containing dehydrogenase